MITATLSCSDDALAAIERHTQSQLDGEVGGFLLGVIEDGAVDVQVALPAAAAVGGRAQVTFTHADWDDVHRAVDKDHPDLRIVGWYHSHPGFGIFLSEHDRFIHTNFFSDPEMVALVRDPHDGALGWFGWVSGEIALIEGSEGVDGQSPVDSGAAPVARLSGANGGGRRSAGRLALAGVATLIVGFALGWAGSLGGQPAEPADGNTTASDVALAEAQADLRDAEQRITRLDDERRELEQQLDDAVAGQTDETPAMTYQVRPGDTLSALAEAFYGAAASYRGLAEANDISDPSALNVGQQIEIPDLP